MFRNWQGFGETSSKSQALNIFAGSDIKPGMSEPAGSMQPGRLQFFVFRALAVVMLALVCRGASAAEFAWQDTTTYRPPSFEKTFAANPEASKRLERVIQPLDGGGAIEGDVVELVHLGLRELAVDRLKPALRGFGNRFIWNHSPQDARAIDLMYHAAGSTNPIIHYHAVYFGLSVVRPLTDPIVHAMVDLAMTSEDPNLLSRVAWGASDRKSDLLKYLQPYLDSTDPQIQKHAEALRQIFAGEIEAFAWSEAKAKEVAHEKYFGKLGEIRDALANGNSAQRREMLNLIQRERVSLLMDDSFLETFAAAASDPDPKNRIAIATIVGAQWIWNRHQPGPAVALMLQLARDSDRAVRYGAMYYGLSTIRNRSEAAIERMIELAMLDGLDDPDFRHRITWGLRGEKERALPVLVKWMSGTNVVKALQAYGFHLEFLGEEPATPDRLADVLKNPNDPVARLVAFGPTLGWKGRSMDEFVGAVRKEVPAAIGPELVSGRDGPPFLIVEQSEATTIENAVLKNPSVQVTHRLPVTVAELVRIGKTGGFKK